MKKLFLLFCPLIAFGGLVVDGVKLGPAMLTGISDISGTGRMVLGTGLNVTNISTSAVGSRQAGQNTGTMTIGNYARGAQQNGYNYSSGILIIGSFSHGSQQNGYNYGGTMDIGSTSYGSRQSAYNITGTMTIEDNVSGSSQEGLNRGTMLIDNGAAGSRQAGYNRGTMAIGISAYGAQQNGHLDPTATATNNGVAALQILNLSSNQHAVTTDAGTGSVLLGAGIASNAYSIVAGDGQVSHGDGSITAGGGFFGSGAGLTDIPVPAYQPWAVLAPVAGTATVTFASGSLVAVTAVASPTVITIDNTGFPTSGVSYVGMELWAGTNSITFAAASITNPVAPVIPTNGWCSLLFRRVGNTAVWTGKGL
ncbi:MAG: hypothetical protein WCK89_24985 [bacterium]